MFGRATIRLGIGPHSSLNYYASAYNRGDNYHITRLKLNRHELNKHASLTSVTSSQGCTREGYKWPKLYLTTDAEYVASSVYAKLWL